MLQLGHVHAINSTNSNTCILFVILHANFNLPIEVKSLQIEINAFFLYLI